MPGQLDFFNAARVNGIAQGAYDPRLQPQPLVWDRRIPTVPAMDDEIMARFIGFPLIADLIADDAKAVTYSFGKFQFETTKIPKLKVGVGMNESMLKLLDRIQQNAVQRDEVGIFSNYENRTISAVRYGVDIRREALLIAMLFDSLNYDRLGIKLNGVTWGMYSDLKVTAGTTWDTAGSATPVADLWAVKLIGSARYGVTYNRVTMSTTAFRYMIATTEFQAKARLYLAPNVSYTNLTLTDIEGQRMLAQNVLGMTIELDDRRYWTQDSQGVVTSQPLHPIAGVLLTSTQMDNNSGAWDFANGTLVESTVSRLANGQAPAVPSGPGPVVYPTLSDIQLNAPGVTYWGVQRGFPRKHMLGCNAALTVGTFSDQISTALPY
jgi:hypothetical protein